MWLEYKTKQLMIKSVYLVLSLYYHAAALGSARESNAAQIQDLQVYAMHTNIKNRETNLMKERDPATSNYKC